LGRLPIRRYLFIPGVSFKLTDMSIPGPFFLFRLGLAVLSISRPFLLELSRNMSSSEVLAYLIRPPPTIFPSDPNTLISLCFSVKFKEEELRKLRPKVEAQMKQQRAAASR
jgi:hypothetical protein